MIHATPGPVARRPSSLRAEAQKRPLRTNPSPRGRNTPAFSESEYESDDGGIRTSSAARRPRRSKPIDVARDLIVLHPRDNIKDRMELDGSDLEEFLEALNEEDPMSISIDAPADSEVIVHTPRVNTAPVASAAPQVGQDDGKGLRKSKNEKCKIKRIRSEEQVTWSGPGAVLKQNAGYFEYDADSEDERFLQSLAPITKNKQERSKAANLSVKRSVDSPVSPAQLEVIVAMFERELEIARRFEDKNRAARTQFRRLQACIESSRLILRDLKPLMALSDSASSSSSRRVASREEGMDAVVTRALHTSDSAVLDGAYSEALNSSDHVGPSSPTAADHGSKGGEASSGRITSDKSAVAIKDPLPALYSVAEISALLPWSRARAAMAIAVPSLFSNNDEARVNSSKKPTASNARSSLGDDGVLNNGPAKEDMDEAFDYRVDSKPLVERIYLYWLHKRSRSRTSLLRGFHVFLMENWKGVSSVGVAIPPVTEDELKAELRTARANLVRIRADLDRARLITDLVRKREKVKKMMFRGASDGMDAEFAPFPTTKKGKSSQTNPPTSQLYQFYTNPDSGNEVEEKSSALSKLNGANASMAAKRGRADSDPGRGGEDESDQSYTTKKKIRILDTHKSAAAAAPNVTKYVSKGDRETKNGLVNPKLTSEPLLAKLPQPASIKHSNTPVGLGNSQKSSHRSESSSTPRSKSVPCSLQRAGHHKNTLEGGKKPFVESSVIRSKSGQFVSARADGNSSFAIKKDHKNSKYFRLKK